MKPGSFRQDAADRRLLLPVYLLSVLFLALFVPFDLGVNVPIFIISIYIAAFSYQKHSGTRIDRGSTTLLLIVTVASLPFVLYDSSPFRVLHFLILMGAVFFQLFTMYSCRAYPRLSDGMVFDLGNAVFCAPVRNLDAFWRVMNHRHGHGRYRTVLLILCGIAIALPLLILLSFQFSSADTVYAFLSHQFRTPIVRAIGLILLGLLAALPLATVLYAVFYGYRYRRGINGLKKPKEWKLHVLPAETVLGALIPVCILQILYLILQMVYFVSTLSGYLPTDFTYAQYARQGFLELCGVALLNILLIGIAMSFTKYRKPRQEHFVRWIVVLLSVCALAMIGVALAKMFLYMQSFGLTTNRIITSWFMLGLILVFICTIVRCFRPQFKLVRTVTVAALVMFLMLCFADCDYLAVSYNRTAFLDGQLQGFDLEMLQDASDSVIPLVIEVYENAEGALREDAANLLRHYAEKTHQPLLSWRSFNISGYQARETFLLWQQESGFER